MNIALLGFIRGLIYHPVNARMAYDFVIALLATLVSYLLLVIHGLELVNIILFPVIFIALNFATGVYSLLKLAPSWQKSLALSSSAFITFLILFLLGGSLTPLANSFIIIAALTSTPRIFLNFANLQSRNTYITQIINVNSPTLIIGGGGYIGSVLVDEMLKQNINVRVFDKFIYGKNVFSDLESNKNLELVEGDATDIYALTQALRNVKAVVHLAGIVGDPASMVDDRLTRHMNIISTRMIKEEVKGLRIPKFIFASSCSVYGTSNNKADEKSALNPLSPYAKSKIDSEKELLLDTFDEFHPTVLRFATVFGHSRKPRFDLVANLFVAQALTHGYITVAGDDQWRPFIHTKDVARAIIQILEAETDKITRQIYNVGDDNMHLTIGELAKLVQRILEKQKKVKIIVRSDNAADLRNYRVSFKKIRDQFNFRCLTTVEEGIKEIVEHFEKGTYKKPYTDVYYSALETTKEIKKEFYSERYRRTHFSDLPLGDISE